MTACVTRKRRAPKADPGWQYVVEHWDQLWSLCRRLCRKGREDLVEELFSDVVVVFVPDLVRRYDPMFDQPLKVWVDCSIRRYVCKWFTARAQQHERLEPLSSELSTLDGVPLLLERDSVASVLRLVNRADRRLLTLRFLRGLTHAEIGERIGRHENTVCEDVGKAVIRARQAAMSAALERSQAYRERQWMRQKNGSTNPVAMTNGLNGKCVQP